jgi:bacteriophage N4 adsorption protein B
MKPDLWWAEGIIMLHDNEILAVWKHIAFLQEELLIFAAFWFFIGAIDDLLIDVIWGVRSIFRRFTIYRTNPPLRADNLPLPKQSGLIVIFIPAWQEAAVIGAMLARTRLSWANGDVAYRIYVGCYPNDEASIFEVNRAARFDQALRLVICDTPGPTTKADCLNRLWRALTVDELKDGVKAKAVVLHDAEDSVHPDALRLFDYLVEKAAGVQLPVIPVRVPGSRWISGHYCDEFAESHGKALVVREAIGAALPLAGVGCAVERNRLGRIAIERDGDPFDPKSLTEDYELGLGIGHQGGKVILARMLDRNGTLVGTRACFPDQLDAAVRQKTRWMTGIALAGWDRLGWQGGVAEFWMRLRDRKAVFAAVVLAAAYLCIVLSVTLLLAELSGLTELRPISSTAKLLLMANGAMLLWRLAMRSVFVGREQGWADALFSIPRTILANIITIMAARRACWIYVRHIFGKPLVWDKTAHSHFPMDSVDRG